MIMVEARDGALLAFFLQLLSSKKLELNISSIATNMELADSEAEPRRP